MYINTHSHIYDKAFDDDREVVLQRAVDAGITMLIVPNNDLGSIKPLHEFYEKHQDYCKVMMGLHPEEIKDDYKKSLSVIEKELEQDIWTGVGEIGLDYYWDRTYEKQQVDAFVQQLRWAKQLGLPVSIHNRDSFDTLIKVLEHEQDGNLRGVLHCFSGNIEQAYIAMKLGMYLGFGGVVTYKNSKLRDVIEQIPTDRILLETDDPYLPPVPYRGQRNEPAYMIKVAEKIAEFKGIDIKKIEEITTKNANNLFKL